MPVDFTVQQKERAEMFVLRCALITAISAMEQTNPGIIINRLQQKIAHEHLKPTGEFPLPIPDALLRDRLASFVVEVQKA